MANVMYSISQLANTACQKLHAERDAAAKAAGERQTEAAMRENNLQAEVGILRARVDSLEDEKKAAQDASEEFRVKHDDLVKRWTRMEEKTTKHILVST